MSKTKYYILLFSSVLLLSACSTKKSTFMTRSYHNITSKYNGLFYAKENLKAGKIKLETADADDYTEVLSLYKLGNDRLAKSVYPEMDKAIEKASKVIQKHSIYIKKKEYCKWIDDSYLLIGKAHFYKREFDKSVEMFAFVSKEYKESDIRHEAKLWLLKTYVEESKKEKANHIFTLIQQDAEMPEKILGEAKKIMAYMFMRSGDNRKAMELIREALDETKKKKNKARMAFILAQLHQRNSEFLTAVDYYEEVEKYNPPYEMAFNAKLNRALCSKGDSDDFEKVITPLMKMLNDDKNAEYKDKIYFVLAELYKEQKDMPKAIEHYKLSLSSSVGDRSQQAKTFLTLGKIYFEQPNYQQAKFYYDSTITVLSKKHVEYEEIYERKMNLKGLVKNLNIIAMEDSLLELAAMSEKDRNKIIDDLIKAAKEAEKKKKEEAAIKRQEKILMQQNTRSRQTPRAGGSSWYFYNEQAKVFGVTEFQTKWGERKNEDNWRRSMKSSFEEGEFGEMMEESEEEEDEYALSGDLKNKQTYLKNIPFKEEEKIASKEKIIDAYYQLGRIYEEDFSERKKAIQSYEFLIKNHKGCKHEAASMYYLHKLYEANNNASTSNYYKKRLQQLYPDSEYAQVVGNPSYAQEVKNEAQKVHTLYEHAYNSYKGGNYYQVVSNYQVAARDYQGNPMIPRFEYLNAVAKNKMDQDQVKLKESLEKIISKYPEDSVTTLAKDLLALLNTPTKEIKGKSKNEVIDDFYEKTTSGLFYAIFILPTKKSNINKFKNQVSDFNKKYFMNKKIEVKSNPFSEEKTMVTVKMFKGLDDIMNYYEALVDNNSFLDISAGQKFFIMSRVNYGKFYKDQDVEKYEAFMNKTYF